MKVLASFTGSLFLSEKAGSCGSDVCSEIPGAGTRFQSPKTPLVSVVGVAHPGQPQTHFPENTLPCWQPWGSLRGHMTKDSAPNVMSSGTFLTSLVPSLFQGTHIFKNI